jgi:voltage-gated potassium channel
MTRTWKRWFKSPFAKILGVIIACQAVGTIGFYFLELRPQGDADFFHAVWWTVVTVTTVGYGDFVPHTHLGRILGVFVMFSGIGLVSTLTGNLASFVIERQAQRRKGLLTVKLTGHVIILGWNEFGLDLVRTLDRTGELSEAELVLVNDLAREVRDELAFKLALGERLQFVSGSPSQANVLSRARPEHAKVAYILTQQDMEAKDADQQTIFAALSLRSLAPKLHIYGQVALASNHEHLTRAGVNEVIVPGEIVSHIMGLMGANPGVWNFMQQLLGISGDSPLGFRRLTPEEKRLTWEKFLAQSRGDGGTLPLAVCSLGRDLSLADMLDDTSGLDQFIMELFEMHGQKTTLGMQGPTVRVNPPGDEELAGYDTMIFIKGEGRS